MAICYEAIGDSGGRYWGIEALSTHIKYTRRVTHSGWVIAPTMFGYPVRLKGIYGRVATPSHRKLAATLFPIIEYLVVEGILKLPNLEVRKGGLEAIPDGIKDLSEDKIRGRKLVYSLSLPKA
jgi:aspyridone synthetase trans-acting enoyl reductase